MSSPESSDDKKTQIDVCMYVCMYMYVYIYIYIYIYIHIHTDALSKGFNANTYLAPQIFNQEPGSVLFLSVCLYVARLCCTCFGT